MKCNFATQKGLSDASLWAKDMKNYFENKYFDQLSRYFMVDYAKGYPLILFQEGYRNNRLMEDGNPGDNTEENFYFSVTTMMMILAEQSVYLHSSDSQELFHKASGWPMFSAGLVGFDQHSLLMLKEAELAPNIKEALAYLDVFNCAADFFCELFCSILDGQYKKDDNVSERLTDNITNKNLIMAQMRTFVNQVVTIIQEGINSQDDNWASVLNRLYGGTKIKCFSIENKKSKV